MKKTYLIQWDCAIGTKEENKDKTIYQDNNKRIEIYYKDDKFIIYENNEKSVYRYNEDRIGDIDVYSCIDQKGYIRNSNTVIAEHTSDFLSDCSYEYTEWLEQFEKFGLVTPIYSDVVDSNIFDYCNQKTTSYYMLFECYITIRNKKQEKALLKYCDDNKMYYMEQ